MKIPKFRITLGLSILTAFALPVVSAHAQTTWTFTGATSNDYATSTNWSPSGPPTLVGTSSNVALINNGSAVTYNSGPDFVINGGSTLEITNGSWTQIGGGGWIQLGQTNSGTSGNGNILVNGGTFNQGTAGNNPFNTSGTGNTFTISSGSAAFNGGGIQVNSPLTWLQSGGNVTSAASLQVQGGGYTQSGGIATITGNAIATNGGGSWTQSGGVLNISGNLQLNSGAGNFLFSSGTINETGAEVDFSNLGSLSTMTGGVLNITRLFTMVNGPTGSSFNFGGGLVNDLAGDGNNGWYGSGTGSPFNFTVASTGTLQFLANPNNTVSLSYVQGLVNAGDITYNSGSDAAAFSVTQTGSDVDVTLLSVPEPSTYALVGLGGLGIFFVLRRKRAGSIS